MNLLEKTIAGFFRNASRVLVPILLGTIMIQYGAAFAQFTGIVALAPWSLFVGGSLYIFSLTHVLRRLYFPQLDLQLIAKQAIESPVGAGLVFIGICLVIVALITLLGAAIRT